jgi:hypothetical protein
VRAAVLDRPSLTIAKPRAFRFPQKIIHKNGHVQYNILSVKNVTAKITRALLQIIMQVPARGSSGARERESGEREAFFPVIAAKREPAAPRHNQRSL